MDYLGSADYLTSPVSGKVEAWTHYNEWGLIVHNAVLKCGQRELDLVKRYATHDYDSVLELYYAKARFYDAHDRHFTAVDPILDPSQYDLREYVQNPVQLVQYLYVENAPLTYIDPLGEAAAIAGTVVVYGKEIFVVALATWLNTPSGKKVISNTAEIIADGVAYTGKSIQTFVSDVISGKIGPVGTVVAKPPATLGTIVTDSGSSALNSLVDEATDGYMEKAGCKDGEESGSNPKSNKKDKDQSTSKPNSQGKDQSTSNPGGPTKGDGGNGGPPKGTPITPKIRISKKQSVLDHIFREEEGHLSQDTPENRALLESVANDPNNRLGDDIHGNTWYAKTQVDGCQIWVRVRGTIITDGGVNTTPRTWNPITGLCKPTQS